MTKSRSGKQPPLRRMSPTEQKAFSKRTSDAIQGKTKPVKRLTDADYVKLSERFGPFKPRILRIATLPGSPIYGSRVQLRRAMREHVNVLGLDGPWEGHLIVLHRNEVEDI